MKKFIILLILLFVVPYAFALNRAAIICGGSAETGTSCTSGEFWEAEDQTQDTSWSGGGLGSNDNLIVLVQGSVFQQDPANCTQVRIEVMGRSGSTTVITASSICEQAGSGDAYDCASGTLNRITWNTGQNGYSWDGDNITSDWITFSGMTLSTSKNYLVKFYNAPAALLADYLQNAAGTFTWRYASGTDESQTENITRSPSTSNIIWLQMGVQSQ